MPTSCPITGTAFSVARNNHRSHRGSNLLPSNIMASALTTIPPLPRVYTVCRINFTNKCNLEKIILNLIKMNSLTVA